MAKTPVLTFEVYRGSEFLHRQDLTAESVTIGKGPAAMLRINDDALSDLQAVINVNENGTIQLLDIVGEGNTKVNGNAVVNAELKSGDAIEIGDIKVVFSVPAGEEFSDEEATQMMRAPAPAAAEDGDEVTEHHGAAATEGADAPAAADAVQESGEDVMAFVMRSGNSQAGATTDRSRPPVLEVAEIWNEVLVDVRHFAKGGNPVTIGTSTGHRWRFLRQPIAWVPAAFSNFAWMFGPTLSEVNEEWRTEFYVPTDNFSGDQFNLFTWEGSSWVAHVSSKWGGFADIGEERKTLQELIESGRASATGDGFFKIEVTENTRLVLDIGHAVFFAQMVPASKKVVAKLTDNVDYPFVGIMSFASFLGIMLAIIALTTPPPPEPEMSELDKRFVELLLEKPPEEVQEKKPDANKDAGEGAKAKREEGKVGKKDAKMEKAKGEKVEMDQRQIDKEIAENAGVLGAMRDGAVESMLGDTSLSADMANGIGGLIGANGTQMGAGGLGSRGGGLGGGGTADGLGGLGTKGRGSGSSGYGSGGGSFGEKSEGGLAKLGGDPIIMGALDKSLIDAVIKRNMAQIKYCYQRELTKNPSLGGKIVVKFVIAKDGTVSSASTKASTMNSPAVEECINGRFIRFQFPEPKGGGIVIVSYPFLFSSE